MPVVTIIDDDAMICDLVGECQAEAGMEAHTATTAESDLVMLANPHFDLALTDVLLADTSGVLLAEIAANQNTPVSLMSDHADAALRPRQSDVPHMLKPFDTRRLSDEAARLIADRHRTVWRMSDGLARLRANLAGFEIETAHARRLIAKSREILARANEQQPR